MNRNNWHCSSGDSDCAQPYCSDHGARSAFATGSNYNFCRCDSCPDKEFCTPSWISQCGPGP